MVSAIEDNPETLLDPRKISLHDVIVLECLLEIDALEYHFGAKWKPLGFHMKAKPVPLFQDIPYTELSEVMMIWQEAYEWSYYDQVLSGLKPQQQSIEKEAIPSFQAVFCIDNRVFST